MEPSKTSLAYLEKWLSHVERSIAPRTFERYQEIACKNLVPLLGQIFLTKLRPEQIAAAYARTLKTGRRDGAGGLSFRTVRYLHRVLTRISQTAIRASGLRSTSTAMSCPEYRKTPRRRLTP
jgi:Phage integrase, N-terminal SAM-like domain